MRRFLLLLPLLSSVVLGQDISYNDVFSLLDAKEYKKAEPLLRQYLQTQINISPSAYLEFGNIYYQKAVDDFLSDDDERTVQYLDSAVIYYNLTITHLNENNLKGNESFYDDLNRGSSKRLVKLKEAHNQLEDRIKKINRKIKKLRRKSDDNKTDEVIRTGNGKFYALIIGVSSYIDNRLNLDQPTKDAETLRQLLVNDYSFDEKDVTLLLDPPRQEILKAMFAFRKKLTQRDNLLVFYAGHGYWDEEASQGYWWPGDATPDDPSFWLSNSDIREQLRGIKSAHSLVISDACFSGGILRTRNADEIRDAPTDIILLYKQPSRRAITSGNLSAVPDKSVFFEFLKKKLEDNEEKYLPSQVLFDNIRKSVINNSLILPQDGVITDTGDQGGDFIFIRKKSKREN